MWACICFPSLGPCLGGFSFGSFCLLGVLWHLASQWPFLPWLACGVLGRAGGSARGMGLSAILTCMLFLEGWCFWLLLLWKKLRSLAPFVDNMDSFGSEAHGIEVVCYGYVRLASFKNLGCCGLEVKGKQFPYQLTVWGHRLDRIGYVIPFPYLLGSCIYWWGPSDGLPIHLGFLQP